LTDAGLDGGTDAIDRIAYGAKSASRNGAGGSDSAGDGAGDGVRKGAGNPLGSHL